MLLRNEAEAMVRCFFLCHFTSEAQGGSTGEPAGCLFAPLWLHVVSTSFSMSSVESMLGIDCMSNCNLNVLE